VIAQAYLEEGLLHAWAPPHETLELFTWNMLRLVAAPHDATLIRQYLAESRSELPPGALSPSGALVLQGLTGSDPTLVNRLIAALPPEIHAEFTRLSPRTEIRQLITSVFLLHDPNDPFMPRVEAIRLAEALLQSGNPAHYAQFALFEYVRPRPNVGSETLWDGVRLSFFLAPMLRSLK